MLIQKIQNVEKKGEVKKAKKTSSNSGFVDLISESDDIEETTVVSEVNTASSLFSLQELEVSDKLTKEQNVTKTEETINNLEKYQQDILNMEQNSVDISVLATNLSKRTRSSDSKLESIIDEVELRAAVEAAKKENK